MVTGQGRQASRIPECTAASCLGDRKPVHAGFALNRGQRRESVWWLWRTVQLIEAEAGSQEAGSGEMPPSGSVPSSDRKIAIPVDLSDESAYAVRWAVANYVRPGDHVILLHVRPTSVLYGADWGPASESGHKSASPAQQQQMEDEFEALTASKADDLAKPLVEAKIPHKIHIVKDHDMKERICLEVERLGAAAVIMGSRGFGAAKRSRKARLGSVSDYCVHHCDVPVVVVRLPEEKDAEALMPAPSC